MNLRNTHLVAALVRRQAAIFSQKHLSIRAIDRQRCVVFLPRGQRLLVEVTPRRIGLQYQSPHTAFVRDCQDTLELAWELRQFFRWQKPLGRD